MTTALILGRAAGLAAVVALGAVGCGGDDDNGAGPAAASTEVLDSASAGSAAFTSYITALGANDDNAEPLLIKSTFSLPEDDTAEPTPLT